MAGTPARSWANSTYADGEPGSNARIDFEADKVSGAHDSKITSTLTGLINNGSPKV